MDRYLDDLKVGEVWLGPPIHISQDAIIKFATDFDPQPMHIDEASAKAGRFGGLIASGWHVAALVMRQFVDLSPFGSIPMLGIRIDELCWRHPVRPEDTLTVRREIIEITPSATKPDRGTIRTSTTVTNQDGVTVMTFYTLIQMPVRQV